MLVTVVIILSKVSGFVRDMILANYFGTGMANDAYVSAYSLFYLPVLLFNSCISATLIPLYVQEREQHSLKQANQFASNTLNLFALTIELTLLSRERLDSFSSIVLSWQIST